MSELTREELAAFRAAESKATKGEWQVQDGCSWRRIGAPKEDCSHGDGNVIRPVVHPRDGWLDIEDGAGGYNLKLIVLMRNNWLRLIEAAERGMNVKPTPTHIVPNKGPCYACSITSPGECHC